MTICLEEPVEKTKKVACKERRDFDEDPVSSTEVEGWAILRGYGMSPKEIAKQAGVGVRKVTRGLKRFDLGKIEPTPPITGSPPRMEVLFPVGPLTPTCPCPHDGPIPRGAKVYCSVCDKSGLDDVHPHLVRNPSMDPLDLGDGLDDATNVAELTHDPSMDPRVETESDEGRLLHLSPTLVHSLGREAALINRILRRSGRPKPSTKVVDRQAHYRIAA